MVKSLLTLPSTIEYLTGSFSGSTAFSVMTVDPTEIPSEISISYLSLGKAGPPVFGPRTTTTSSIPWVDLPLESVTEIVKLYCSPATNLPMASICPVDESIRNLSRPRLET